MASDVSAVRSSFGQAARSSYMSSMVAYAVGRGLPLSAIEARTGMKGFSLFDPNGSHSDDFPALIWDMLEQRFPNEVISLSMAISAPYTTFGALFTGAEFAKTLRIAMTRIARNRLLYSPLMEMTFTEEGDEYKFTCNHPRNRSEDGRGAELGMGLVVRFIREVLGLEQAVKRIELTNNPHGPLQHYHEFYHVPVRFAQPEPAVILCRASLDQPLRQADVELFTFIERYFEEGLRLADRDGLPVEVQRLREGIVQNASRGEFSAAAAAAGVNMSLRAAQRLAAEHGTSLQDLITDVRRAAAEKYLSNREIDTETVAALTGYSEARAFRRAFKRWTGQTPSEFRRLLPPSTEDLS
ncbi:MAG: AraC family transcriptional regulator ligand-binding domain-containing protein [Pseudomonadota bacterium]